MTRLRDTHQHQNRLRSLVFGDLVVNESRMLGLLLNGMVALEAGASEFNDSEQEIRTDM